MQSKRFGQGLSGRRMRPSQRGRRGFLGMMGGTGAALVAAACGGSNNNAAKVATTVATRAAATTAATAAATSAAAATAAGTAAAAGTTPAAPLKAATITLWGADTAPEEAAFHKKLNDDFHAAFPPYQAQDSQFSAGDIYLKLQTALASHTEPDILFKEGHNLVPLLWDQGLLLPVNDVMEDVYKMVGGKDKFSATAVARYTTSSGDLIGIPNWAGPWVWWFRQDLLQEAGLTPPADHWDWNFLLKAVKAVHKPPSVYGLAMPLARNNACLQHIGALILGNGGHFVSADLKDVLFDSPEVRDAVDLIKELAQYTPPDAPNWGNPDQVGAIVKGTCAMGMYLGRVFGNLVTMNPSLIGKMSNTTIPYNKQPSNWGGAYSHGVFKSSKSPQAAKEMVKFSFRKEQYIAWMLTAPGYYSAEIPSYGTDPSYTDSPVLKAFDPKLVATFANSEKNFADFLIEGPGWKSNSKAGALEGSLFYADVLQKVVIGKESTQSALTAGATAIRDVMKG